jgi:hypothetical protein
MIIRVFRAGTKPSHTAADLARMAKEVTIPSLEGERGLLARYAGTGLGRRARSSRSSRYGKT